MRARNDYNNRHKKDFKLITKEKNCKFCKNKYVWTSSRPQQLYCSKECCKNYGIRKYELLSQGIITTPPQSYNYCKLRFEIMKRDSFTCQYCGRNVIDDKIKIHVDHIHPKSKGGKFEIDNLVTSCEECNLGKRDILLDDRLKHKEKIL